MATATIRVPGLKVTVPLKPDMLPKDLVPPEPAPVGETIVELALEGGFTAGRRSTGRTIAGCSSRSPSRAPRTW